MSTSPGVSNTTLRGISETAPRAAVRKIRFYGRNWKSAEWASVRLILQRPAYLIVFINLGVRPDMTALLRFLSGVSLEVPSLIHSVRQQP